MPTFPLPLVFVTEVDFDMIGPTLATFHSRLALALGGFFCLGACQQVLGIENVRVSGDGGPPSVDAGSTISVSIVNAPLPITAELDATFGFIVDGRASAVQCRIDDAAFADCVSPFQIINLNEGSRRFEVRATDIQGFTGPEASFAWVIDLTPLDTNIDSGPASILIQDTAVFSFSASEPTEVDLFECSLNSATFTECESPLTLLALGDGMHQFEVRAIDLAGNVDATPASQDFNVDTGGPPDTSITSTVPVYSNSQIISFTFTSTKPTESTFECRLDGIGMFTACSSGKAYSALSEGPHFFEVRALDGANQPDLTPARADWVVDLTPPITQVTSGPPGLSANTQATFVFSSLNMEAGGVTFGCKLNNAADYTSCISGQVYGVGGGSNNLQIQATDAAGNVEVAPVLRTWLVGIAIFDTGTAQLDGDLGGRNGANATCTSVLTSGNIVELDEYNSAVALLCVSSSDDAQNIPAAFGVPSGLPIYFTSGSLLSDDWIALLGGADLYQSLSMGGLSPVAGNGYWMGCSSSGAVKGNSVCQGWTSNSGGTQAGRHAITNTTAANWLDGNGQDCDSSLNELLCIAY